MSLSTKRMPNVEDPAINRIVKQIYDDINSVIQSVNNMSTDADSSVSGKPGDIKIVKNSSGSHEIEARTEEGWAGVNLTLKEN